MRIISRIDALRVADRRTLARSFPSRVHSTTRLAMKRRSAFLSLALSLCFLASSAAAADKVKGTVKQVDEKARTITFAAEGAGKDEVLPVDKAVELKSVKPNAKVQLTVDGGVVKEIKAERARSAPGY
jgi:ABC-type glycerol-3-phosphate transport system substrate-binding protein